MGLTWKQRVFTALLGTAAVSGLTALLLILVGTINVLLPPDTKFGIVFDAGSSHTSLFVYQWPANKENDTGMVSQALACQAEGSGISSYASNPARVGESLQGCLEEALALIPKAKHHETPMFLGATAGMRLLSRKNRSQAEDVFAAVRQALGQSPVDFRGAELLTGQDEGAFGWITINYVLGLLVKYSFSGEWIRPLEETLVGALDMGGASTQITFVPGGPILDKTTQATFRLYGADHTVYTHSYLCFGRDQALSRLLAELLQASPGLLVRHPCYHSGYRGTLALAPLYESPCVPAAPPGLSQNLTVEGTGNPGACVEALRKLFNFSSCDGREDCAFAGVYQPPVQGQFYVSPLSLPSGPSFLLEAKGPNPRRPWGAWDPGWGGLGLSPAHPGPRPQGHVAPPTGFLQLLLHLPLPEPHLQAVAERGQRHRLAVLPAALEAGGGERARGPGPLAAGLLCFGPVLPHTPGRGLRVQ
uniref:Ectonucleoside triphosphate diphosphohydrolase 8 n=1 Tax=Ovis aries TaxID=9940 RepID=A0AC11CFQ8_SHEEP